MILFHLGQCICSKTADGSRLRTVMETTEYKDYWKLLIIHKMSRQLYPCKLNHALTVCWSSHVSNLFCTLVPVFITDHVSYTGTSIYHWSCELHWYKYLSLIMWATLVQVFTTDHVSWQTLMIIACMLSRTVEKLNIYLKGVLKASWILSSQGNLWQSTTYVTKHSRIELI